MKCRGNFKFRGLQKIDAGDFVNDKGESIPYKASFKLKLDEITDNGIQERIFKIATDSVLVSQFKDLKPYQDVCIDFEVQLYANGCRVVPVALIK